ncbi:hypothetical protein [Neorhizobium tomejilense]|uniref:hypothetical protein n=1 Tax=Neorhizobium tomejilense TaxID=2093828 RepID=UPI00155E45BC|nr:hypothetical protein [Neorhizobium tomejilense]
MTLGTVAVVAVLFRNQIAQLLATRRKLLDYTSKSLEALAGIVLMLVAVAELLP